MAWTIPDKGEGDNDLQSVLFQEHLDVLVDGMRGPSSIWYRIRINLQHVPDEQRPPQEELIADYSPWPTR